MKYSIADAFSIALFTSIGMGVGMKAGHSIGNIVTYGVTVFLSGCLFALTSHLINKEK